MAFLADAKLDEVLRAHNPWWVSGALPGRVRYSQPRRQDELLKKHERPTLLVGPRRSGKTATLMRMLDGELRAGRRPRDLAYLPLDHPLLRVGSLGPLVDRTLKLMEPDGRPLILLDALQAVPDWPERFREVVETRPHPRLVAVASVSPGSEESAYDTVYMPPLRFREFCALRGVPELDAPPLDLLEPRMPEQSDPADDYLFDRVLDPVLADYLVRGGFPEAAFEPELALAHQAVRNDVVARAVYQDLPAVVGVLKLADLERVLLATQLHGTGPLTIEAFADALDLDRSTVVRYVDHLSRAFLLTSLKNFAAATDRSRARIFPIDPALPNALLERGAGVLAYPEARRGLLVSAIVSHVEHVARERGFDTAYFREGEIEADVVVVSPGGAMPIVVVDREDLGEEEAAAVERVMKRMQATRAFLLSRARPRRKTPLSFFESVYHMPAAYFLYALGA
ncbi:MAG: ATP-binding protein [Planctomycetota bacterium]